LTLVFPLRRYFRMQATREFIKRNRKNLAVGFGLVGSTYFATNYVLGKLSETREKLASERIAKEKCATQKRIIPSLMLNT
jgi:hypothetical protein